MNMPTPSLRRAWITICTLIVAALVVVIAWTHIQSQTVMTQQHSHTVAQQANHSHCADNAASSEPTSHSPNQSFCQAVCAVHCVGGIPPTFELTRQLFFPARFPPTTDAAVPSLHLAPTPPPPKRV